MSHQWFIQWFPPSTVLADVNREYQSINHRWNDEWSSPVFKNVDKEFDYYDHYEPPDYVQRLEEPTYNDDYTKFKNNGEFFFIFGDSCLVGFQRKEKILKFFWGLIECICNVIFYNNNLNIFKYKNITKFKRK